MQQYYAPDFEVRISGLTMEADVKKAVISLSYDNNHDLADKFDVTLDNSNLRFTDSPLFSVGKEVEIHMGYAGNLKPMMLGEIVSVNPSFPESGAPTIGITGYDKSHRMRKNHKTRSFLFSNASLIAAQIAAEHLLIPAVDPTPAVFESKSQDCPDMTLLKELARQTFFETFVHWDKLYFRLPRPQTEAVHLEWGKNLSSFSPKISTSGQKGLIKVSDYNQKLAQTIVGLVPVIATDFNLDEITERLGESFLDQIADFGIKNVTNVSIKSFPDAFTFAKAILQELLEGLFEGSGTCIGLPELRAGEMVEISGLGKRFSGKYRLRSVKHSIDGGGYRTTFEVTQRNSDNMMQFFRKALEDEESPNKQKKMNGKVIGKVINNVDPTGLGQVQLSFPGIDEKLFAPTARVVQQDIGNFFMPDVGEDVLVDFEKGDFDRPLVTGVAWNVKTGHPDGKTPTSLKQKIIRSRNGHKLVLSDLPGQGGVSLESSSGVKVNMTDDPGKQEVTLENPAGAKIKIDNLGAISANAAQGQKITLDAAGNKVDIDSATGNIVIEGSSGAKIMIDNAGKLTVNTVSDLVIASQGKVQIGSSTDIALSATNNIDLTAKNVNVTVSGKMDVS